MSAGQLNVVESRSGDVLTLALTGRLDGTSSGVFQSRILSHIEAGARRLILDLSHLDYVNSLGVGVFVLAAKMMKPVGGRIVLYGLRPMVKHIFEIAGFETIFPIAATHEDAKKFLGS